MEYLQKIVESLNDIPQDWNMSKFEKFSEKNHCLIINKKR